MSVEFITRVWRHSQHKGDALLVMLAMADWCDDFGTCYPSVKKLATKSRLTERGVQKVMRRLEASGEVEIVEVGGTSGGRKFANTYRLKLTPKATGEQRAPVPLEAPTGEPTYYAPVNPRSPYTSVEPSKDTPKGSDELFGKEAVEFPEIPPAMRSPELLAAWCEWCKHRRQKRQALTPLAIKKQVDEMARWILQGGPRLVVLAIEHSIKAGYTGLFLPKGAQNGSHKPRGPITQENALKMPTRP